VRVSFEDGSSYEGTILVGADGAWSAVHQILAPSTFENRRLPCNAIGTSFFISEEKMNKLRNEVDPLYFSGTDPKTNTYSFWSLLEQPKVAGGLDS
jgi:2-polyprenyl-6-methoxyphenol hydroxylase-like FAD-dependent oxidoreductase